ncbi:MAG: hypothetical protein M1830_005964, partial [Pleopsidium flavum]
MMVLSRVSSETVPSDVNVRSMFDIIDLRIAAWLSTHTSALVTALLSTVRKCMGAVPEPTACHDMILDFVKAIGKYLDSSNSDLPFGICLAANLPEKSFLLFIDTDSSVKKIFCLTKDDIALRDGKAFNYSLTLSPISNELPEHVRTLHLGKLLAVR